MTDFEQVFYQVFDYFKGDEKSFSHLSMVELARQITINLPKVVTQDSEPKIIFYPWKENKTFEKVKEIIMDTINCSEDKITLEANLKDDLGIDSLDSMELMMAVEDAYGITVPEEELPNLTSVKAIVEYVDKNAA